jgi:signal transduction histidine kinase/ligand-binding sensor domain-containing protein
MSGQRSSLRRSVLLLGWLASLILPPVWAQTLSAHKVLGRYQQLLWQDQHGLPQNGVLAIQRTRDGYLWLGTIEGAARFDGVRFTVFDNNNTPEIKNNQILSLAEDQTGKLWLGAVGGGLTSYQNGQFRLYTRRDGLSSDFVRSLLADRAGNLWIGTRGGGLNLYRDGKFTAYTTRDGLPSDSILTLAEDQTGVLWIGTNKGLASFEQGRFTAFGAREGLPHERVNALLPNWGAAPGAAGTGNLLVGTGGGLCQLAAGRCVPYKLPVPTSVTALYQDRQNNLWIGTGGSGLFLHRQGRLLQYAVRDGLPSDTVLVFYQDPEGDLWCGTVDGGLVQMREGRFDVYTTEDGLPHNFVSAVFEDLRGSLWLSTNGGLSRLKDGRLTSYPLNQSRPESGSIAEDRAGNLWFSGNGQLIQIQHDAFKYWTAAQGLPHEPVRELLGDRSGNLWISTPGHGLAVFRDGRFRHFDTSAGLADNEVTALYESPTGQVWAGLNNGGISRFEAATQRFTSWTAQSGLPGDHVQAFYEDRAGTLWIATSGGGLYRFKAGRFAAIKVKDGLFDNRIFQILSDDAADTPAGAEGDSANLWMSCNRGIFRVSLRELNDFAEGRRASVNSFVYGVADGMLSRECNSGSPGGWKTRDGRLWFPTVKGVVVIDPRQRNIPPSKVAIERVILDRLPLPSGQAVQIKPDQENLEIEYTGLNWNRPQQIRFKYQLAGFNQAWVDAGTRRTAYFSNLPPGAYTFKVLADNGEGVWNSEGPALRIVVLPPFYRTWWFLTLIIAGTATALGLAVRLRLQQLHRRHARQQAFSGQLIASQEAERKRIAAELHDSLGQQLLIIKNWAMIGLSLTPRETNAHDPLNEISTTASEAIEEVREVIYDLRPYQLDKIGLTSTLRFMIEKVATASGIHFETELGELDDLFSYDAQLSLYRIVQECVSNIVRHSQASRARVVIEPQGPALHVTIEDNGRGFTPDRVEPRKHGGFGLTGLHERVRLLGGRESIVSAPGQGTKILITIEL